jgi:hypothetical protein
MNVVGLLPATQPADASFPARGEAELARRDALEKGAGRRKTAQGLAMRARILLLADEGASNKAIAADLALDPAAVSQWRNRVLRDRVEGLCDRPRSGAPRRIWPAFGLKPHRTKTFKLSTDPNFVGKVRDIVGL